MLYLHSRIDFSSCSFHFQILGLNLHLPAFVFISFPSSNFRFLLFFYCLLRFLPFAFPMLKNASSVSMSNNQNFVTVGFVLHRNKRVKYFCQDESVLHTASDINRANYGRKFWGCRNYRNRMGKSCTSSSGYMMK